MDICEGALGVAEENAKKHQVSKKIRFLKNDLFEANRIKNLGYFDFIASNPPYIDTKQLEHLMTDVKNFEPRLALDGGENGLRFYRHIIPRASDFLKEQGWLIMEIGWDQAEAVSKIIKDTDIYREPLVCLDYSGFPRVVMANKKKHG